MDHVLDAADKEGLPVLLFANPSVVDFYPRFGFKRLVPDRLSINLPAASDLPLRTGGVLDPEVEADQSLLAFWCERASPHGGVFSARPDASVILWHLMNTEVRAHVLPDEKGLVFLSVAEGQLKISDWLSSDGLSLTDLALLRQLAAPYGDRLELGFVPGDAEPFNRLSLEPMPEAFMFWRGLTPPRGVLHFPALVTT